MRAALFLALALSGCALAQPAWDGAKSTALNRIKSPGQVTVLTLRFAPAAPEIQSVYPLDDIREGLRHLR